VAKHGFMLGVFGWCMAVLGECPHCGKKNVPHQHPRFCTKNPERVSNPSGRPKAGASSGEPVSNGRNGVGVGMEAQELVFNVEPSGREPGSMPDLTMKEPAATAPIAPVPVDLGPVCDTIVATVCEMENGLVASRIPKVLPVGCPELPGPVSETQRATLSVALQPVVAKWLPMLGDHPEVVLLVVAGGIFVPRWLAANRVIQFCNDAEAARRAAPATSPAPPPMAPVRHYTEAELLAMGDASAARVGVGG
jgi:hypothetical protein